jgi:hypothetical protein
MPENGNIQLIRWIAVILRVCNDAETKFAIKWQELIVPFGESEGIGEQTALLVFIRYGTRVHMLEVT